MADGKSKHWEQGAVSDPGYLRRATHTPAGHDIPESKIKADEHSKNKHLAEAARLADVFKHEHGNPHKKS